MQLSVVIPFYQVEKYIGACLDALAALPAEESEILLVDDCGQDGSAAIAAAYCAAHPNARVIRRAQNGGLSATRGWTRRGANTSIFWIATMCRARRRSGG